MPGKCSVPIEVSRDLSDQACLEMRRPCEARRHRRSDRAASCFTRLPAGVC